MTVNGIDASYYYAQDFDRAVSFYTALIGSPPPMLVPGMFAEWEFKGGEAFGLYKGEHYEHCDASCLPSMTLPLPSRNYARAACISR